MGRLSRYKKIRSIDPFAKNGSWKSDVGDCTTLKRVKKKSMTATKMKEAKNAKMQRRMRGKQDEGDKKRGGSNGFGDDVGYDLPPDGEDEFDINDMVGSVKKQKNKAKNELLAFKVTPMATVIPSRGVGGVTNGKSADNSAKSSKKQNNNAGGNKSKTHNDDGTLKITAKTPTREIIEACNNPKQVHKNANKNNSSSATNMTKQEKKKAFLKEKKLKKRKRGKRALDDDDDDEDYAKQQALQSLHSQSHASSALQDEAKTTKKHTVKQQNYSETMIARTAFDDPVERPPTFTRLPRGADKLAKNKKKKYNNDNGDSNLGKEDGKTKDERIRKEQQALEAMRERVMKQYAVLRESRRSGNR